MAFVCTFVYMYRSVADGAQCAAKQFFVGVVHRIRYIDVDVNCGTVLISYDVLNVISFSKVFFSVRLLFFFSAALLPPNSTNKLKCERRRIP